MTQTRKHKRRPALPSAVMRPVGRESMLYTSVQERWVNGEGRRNTVTIRNRGPAEKRVEAFDPQGRVTKTKTRRLSAAEKKKILEGVFVPRLWSNCRLDAHGRLTCASRR